MESVIKVEAYREYLETLISRYVDADLVLAESKAEIGGKLGRGNWAVPGKKAQIILPKEISEEDAENCLLALAIRGQINNRPELCADADSVKDGRQFLTHLTLHEIAHVKNRWGQDCELDCDVWAHKEMVKIDKGDT